MLQPCLDLRNRADDRLRVLADPAIVDEADRHRVEEMVLAAPLLAGCDEPRPLQDPEVAHHAKAGHLRKVGAELSQRLAVLFEQHVEQESPARIVERLENLIHGLEYR